MTWGCDRKRELRSRWWDGGFYIAERSREARFVLAMSCVELGFRDGEVFGVSADEAVWRSAVSFRPGVEVVHQAGEYDRVLRGHIKGDFGLTRASENSRGDVDRLTAVQHSGRGAFQTIGFVLAHAGQSWDQRVQIRDQGLMRL
jgi:hypothetical protein